MLHPGRVDRSPHLVLAGELQIIALARHPALAGPPAGGDTRRPVNSKMIRRFARMSFLVGFNDLVAIYVEKSVYVLMVVPTVLPEQRFSPPADVRCQLTHSLMGDQRDTVACLMGVVGVSVTLRPEFAKHFLLRIFREAVSDFLALYPFHGMSALGRDNAHTTMRQMLAEETQKIACGVLIDVRQQGAAPDEIELPR